MSAVSKHAVENFVHTGIIDPVNIRKVVAAYDRWFPPPPDRPPCISIWRTEGRRVLISFPVRPNSDSTVLRNSGSWRETDVGCGGSWVGVSRSVGLAMTGVSAARCLAGVSIA